MANPVPLRLSLAGAIIEFVLSCSSARGFFT